MNISLPPAHIQSHHWQEWVIGSGVDPSLTALNLRSLSGNTPYDYLLYSDKLPRRNDGRLSEGTLKRYRHLEAGGWWCSGIDPLSLEESLWSCFKPDCPRKNSEGKLIKYEHPPKIDTELFVLRVPFLISWNIVRRQNEQAYQTWFERFWPVLQSYVEKEYPELTQTNRHSNADESEATICLRELYQACQGGEHSEVNRLLYSVWDRPRNYQTRLELLSQSGVEGLVSLEDRGFWEWVINHPIPLAITEGAKKAAALLTAGYVAIALPGIFNGYRQPKDEQGNKIGNPSLILQLAAFAQKGRKIDFVFDCDTKPATIGNVNKAINTTAKLLQDKGCECRIVSWTKQYKGADDFIVACGAEAFDSAYLEAQPVAVWQVSQLKQLTYPVSVEIDPRLRYLPPLFIPASAKLICIKARKGRGKTQQIAPLVEQASAKGIPTLIISHRRQLVEDLCRRCGIDTITEIRHSQTRGLLGFGLCIDSLHLDCAACFDPSAWHDAIVVIDEVEQVLWHLLDADTEVKKHRTEILSNLWQLLRNVASSGGGKIIISDADLSNISIDYVRGALGFPIEPYLIHQAADPSTIAEGEQWQITNYSDTNPKRLIADLIAHIQSGGRPFVCVSAQKHKSSYGTRNLEATLRKQFPSRKILRIDSESISDPKHPAYGCIAHLNEVLPQYDIVLASPSIETGVSIDIRGHFTSVWGIAGGVSTDNSVIQALARVRENVPRFLWAAKSSFCRIGNGSTSVKDLIFSQKRQLDAHLHLLLHADGQEWELDGINTQFQPLSMHTWGKFAARINYGMLTYRTSILSALKAEGHLIRDVGGDFDQKALAKLGQMIQQTKEENYQRYCNQICEQEKLSECEYDELHKKQNRTEEERSRLKKTELCRRYCTSEITPQLVEDDERGLYNSLQLHYYLTVGREFLAERDRTMLEKLLHQGKGALFAPDFNKTQLGGKIWILEWLGIPALLDQEQLHKDDPALCQLAQTAKCYAADIQKFLKLSLHQDDSPVVVFRKLIRCLGIRKLIPLGRLGPRGERHYVYALPQLDRREEIFARWQERDRAQVQQRAESPVTWFIQLLLRLEAPASRAFPSLEALSRFVAAVEKKLEENFESVTSTCQNFAERFWKALIPLCSGLA